MEVILANILGVSLLYYFKVGALKESFPADSEGFVVVEVVEMD